MTPPPPGPARSPTSGTGGRPRIVTVGDVVTDVLAVLAEPLAPGSDTPADIRFTGGGQAANTAAWLAWLGRPVTLVAAIGDDDAGHVRLAELTRSGVHCAVRRHPGTPTGSVIVLAGAGERTMVTERGANLLLTPADVDAALDAAPDARHLHLSAYPLLDPLSREAGLRALASARERGLTTSVDAASAAPLRRVGPTTFLRWIHEIDLLLANTDEAAVLAGGAAEPAGDGPVAFARALAGTGRHAVVKRGPGGAVWARPDGTVVERAARRVPAADVTGAGDAFAAGLLAAWVDGADPAQALDRAGELGAIAVTTVGARPAGDAAAGVTRSRRR